MKLLIHVRIRYNDISTLHALYNLKVTHFLNSSYMCVHFNTTDPKSITLSRYRDRTMNVTGMTMTIKRMTMIVTGMTMIVTGMAMTVTQISQRHLKATI